MEINSGRLKLHQLMVMSQRVHFVYPNFVHGPAIQNTEKINCERNNNSKNFQKNTIKQLLGNFKQNNWNELELSLATACWLR